MPGKKTPVGGTTAARAAVRMIRSWESLMEAGSLSLVQAKVPLSGAGLRRLGRLPVATDDDSDEVHFQVWLYRKEISAVLERQDVRKALQGAVISLMGPPHLLTPEESAVRLLCLMSEVLEALLMKQRSIDRWTKVGTRTDLRRSLQAAQRAVVDITSAIKQVDVLARELRAIQRRHDVNLHGKPQATSPMLLTQVRKSAMQDISRVQEQLKGVEELLEQDIAAKRQAGGKIAQFEDAIPEIDIAAQTYVGAGLDSAPPRRVVFEILQALRPDLEFSEDALRRAVS